MGLKIGQLELTETIARIEELEAQQASIKDELEGLKDTVKAYMVAQGTDRMLVGGYKVSYTKYTTSRFDSTKFKADNESLYKQYLKTTEARRFTIS